MTRQKMTALFLAMAMVVGLSGCGGSSGRLRWPETSLGERLPDPPVKNGEIIVETSDTLHARAVDATEKHYQSFVEDCEDNGFTIDSKQEDDSFSAYDEDGYFVEVRYTKSAETIDITINASMEADFTEIEWPKSEIASSVPVPLSNIGTISWENEDGFVAYIGETSKDEYDEYVDRCYSGGFTIDYSKGDDYFRGVNEQGYHLHLDYKWNETMFIRMDTAEALGLEPPEQTPSQSVEPMVPVAPPETQTPPPVEPQPETPEPTEEPEDEILTVENCDELADILTLSDPTDPAVASFAGSYDGRTIEFDGFIAALSNHGDYDTRYDILVMGGDFDENHMYGPNFSFRNVNLINLGIEELFLPDYISVGSHVHVVATIDRYDEEHGLLLMEPVSVTER